jgi:hypothetical protein
VRARPLPWYLGTCHSHNEFETCAQPAPDWQALLLLRQRPRDLPNWPPHLADRQPLAHRGLAARLVWPQLGPQRGGVSPIPTLSVSSTDRSATVSIDAATGDVVAVTVGVPHTARATKQPQRHTFAMRALSMLLPLLNGTATARWRVSVLRLQNGAGVRVTRTLPDIVQLAEIYSADPSAPSAVRVKLLLVGLGGDERARPPLRLPVSTVVSFEPALAEAVSATVAPPLNRQHRPAAAQLTTPPRADADRGSRGGPPGIEAATTTAPTSGWTHSGHPTATGASGRAPTTMASCTAPDHTPVIWWSLHLWRCSQRKGESGWRTDFCPATGHESLKSYARHLISSVACGLTS